MPAVGSPFLPCSPANCMTASRNKPAAPLNNFKAINYVWKLKLKQFPVFVPCIFSSCFISPHWWDHTAWLCPKFTVQWVEQGKKVRAGDSSAFPAWGAQTAGSWSSPAHLSPEFKRHSRDYFFLIVTWTSSTDADAPGRRILISQLLTAWNLTLVLGIPSFLELHFCLWSKSFCYLQSASLPQLPVLDFKSLLFTCYGNSSSHFSSISHNFREHNLGFGISVSS